VPEAQGNEKPKHSPRPGNSDRELAVVEVETVAETVGLTPGVNRRAGPAPTGGVL